MLERRGYAAVARRIAAEMRALPPVDDFLVLGPLSEDVEIVKPA